MPTLVNVEMNGSDAKMVEKVSAATIVPNKATWPATVQSIDRHPEDENIESQDQAGHKEIRVETVRDGFDPAPTAKNGPRWPRKHLRRPGGGRPREEFNTTIGTSRPKKISTLEGVNVQGTESEHASLFTVRGRICARRDDFFDSGAEVLVDCGATSDFMSMQTAEKARRPLCKLTNAGQVLTAEVSKLKCDTTREPMSELENSYFDITSGSWRFCWMWYLDYHGFKAIIQLSFGRNSMRTSNMIRVHRQEKEKHAGEGEGKREKTKNERGVGAQNAKAQGTQGPKTRNARDKGGAKNKKKKKKHKNNHKQGNPSPKGAEQTRRAPRTATGKGEAHQNAPGRLAFPTRPRRARTRTHARDPGVASSDPRGAVLASTRNSPGAPAESPVEQQTVRETGRVSDWVHTRQTLQRKQPKTNAGGTRQGQPHRGAPNMYDAERAQRPRLGGGQRQ